MFSAQILEQDYKNAMRGRDQFTTEVLRGLKNAIKNAEIEKRGKGAPDSALSDEEAFAVAKRQVKQLEEAKAMFAQGGRQDLVDQNDKEIAILKKYLPEEMPEEQVRAAVQKIISEIGKVGADDFGKVMGAAMQELKGKADGGTVGKMVREMIARN